MERQIKSTNPNRSLLLARFGYAKTVVRVAGVPVSRRDPGSSFHPVRDDGSSHPSFLVFRVDVKLSVRVLPQ
jgi:hypothetical protein